MNLEKLCLVFEKSIWTVMISCKYVLGSMEIKHQLHFVVVTVDNYGLYLQHSIFGGGEGRNQPQINIDPLLV